MRENFPERIRPWTVIMDGSRGRDVRLHIPFRTLKLEAKPRLRESRGDYLIKVTGEGHNRVVVLLIASRNTAVHFPDIAACIRGHAKAPPARPLATLFTSSWPVALLLHFEGQLFGSKAAFTFCCHFLEVWA